MTYDFTRTGPQIQAIHNTVDNIYNTLGNSNLLSNHNFLIASPDDSQPPPDATPRSYPPGFQIFSGVFANETSGITNLTYVNGRVSFSGGDFYMAVANTGAIARLTAADFVASVADFDGNPRTRGVSFALVGDEYRVTVGVDALEDGSGNATPLGSVKFEQGSVATRHDIGENNRDLENSSLMTFETISEAIASNLIRDGMTLRIKNRSNSIWDVVPESSVITNPYNRVLCTGIPSLAIVLRQESEYNLNEMGLVANDSSDQTSAFNDIWALIPAGSKVTTNSGSYLITGGIIDSHHKTEWIAKGFVELYHPLETTTGRTVTKKNVLIQDTNLMKIYGINTLGQHTNSTNGDDNSVQSGISHENCDSCKVILCNGENLQRVFISSGSTSTKYELCEGSTTYNSFLATNDSTKIKWSNCKSSDAYWGKQFEGTPGATLAAGYGFLADDSQYCEAINCESEKSGSDCFRSGNDNSINTKFVNCKSFSPRRNAFSHRSSTAANCQTINCDAFEIGDTSFWTGATGSYTEPASNARGHYVLGDSVKISGGNIINDVDPVNSNMSEIVYLDGATNSIVENVTAKGAVGSAGILTTSASSDCQIIGNNTTVQSLSVSEGIYAYSIGGTNHQVSNNKSKGGLDGYLVTASDTDITDNTSSLTARHGFSINGDSCIFDGNRAYNPNILNTTGAGFFLFGGDITCGTNTAIDDRTPNIMYRAVWISSSATGLFTGQVINRSTVTGFRDDAGVATRSSAAFGKGVPASDITTLLASLRDSEIIST